MSHQKLKVGIEIEEVKLTPDEGMLKRNSLKSHPIISQNRIITKPVGTVFRLNPEEEQALIKLWNAEYSNELI